MPEKVIFASTDIRYRGEARGGILWAGLMLGEVKCEKEETSLDYRMEVVILSSSNVRFEYLNFTEKKPGPAG